MKRLLLIPLILVFMSCSSDPVEIDAGKTVVFEIPFLHNDGNIVFDAVITDGSDTYMNTWTVRKDNVSSILEQWRALRLDGEIVGEISFFEAGGWYHVRVKDDFDDPTVNLNTDFRTWAICPA